LTRKTRKVAAVRSIINFQRRNIIEFGNYDIQIQYDILNTILLIKVLPELTLHFCHSPQPNDIEFTHITLTKFSSRLLTRYSDMVTCNCPLNYNPIQTLSQSYSYLLKQLTFSMPYGTTKSINFLHACKCGFNRSRIPVQLVIDKAESERDTQQVA
jgi:hypothetical protein